MTYEINQIFENVYPPEAAAYCNENELIIKEIEPTNKGARRFQIQEIPIPTEEEKAAKIRSQRNALLTTTDKFMVEDFPISTEDKASYKEYRQYLRNIPTQTDFPNVGVMSFEEWTLKASQPVETLSSPANIVVDAE